ncbi:hypothetical protein HZ326_6256 [Fusarium oxysporum f. sp. albedinis]|nr:hypothetical protein HZ326_6256 [Fusarium oxysporum f. sp. albedinis]
MVGRAQKTKTNQYVDILILYLNCAVCTTHKSILAFPATLRLVGVPVAFFACQITKFALCYPNVGRGLSQRREGVDAASRVIPYQEQLQLHCAAERLIVSLPLPTIYRVPIPIWSL